MFWLGFFILIASHIQMFTTEMRQHATIAFAGTGLMFVGSKIGRAFLGIDQ